MPYEPFLLGVGVVSNLLTPLCEDHQGALSAKGLAPRGFGTPRQRYLRCEVADILAPPKPRKIKSSSKVTKK